MPQKRLFNPAVKTTQFRAWHFCTTYDSDLTISELADKIDVPEPNLRRALRDQKWARHLRSGQLDLSPIATNAPTSAVM